MYYLFPLDHFLVYVNNNRTSKWEQWKGINARYRRINTPLRKLNHYGLWAMKFCNTTRHMSQSFMQWSFNKASLTSRTQWMELTIDSHLFYCSPITLYYWCIHKNVAIDLPPIGHALDRGSFQCSVNGSTYFRKVSSSGCGNRIPQSKKNGYATWSKLNYLHH